MKQSHTHSRTNAFRSVAIGVFALGSISVSSLCNAADIEGVMIRLSVYPNLSKENTDQQSSEISSKGSGNATKSESNTTANDGSQTSVNLGAGYTFHSGLHLGANLWQDSSSYKTTTTSSRSGTTSSESTYTTKDRLTTTNVGPTIAFVHDSGFSAYFTPFMTVATKSESSSDYSSSGYSPSSDPEPEVTNKSKTTGYRLDVAYHYRIGVASIGPELSYSMIQTKIDVTTTEYDTGSNGEVSSSTTQDTGTTKSSRILPMIGMSYTL